MARISQDQLLTPSVLDRLLDDDPDINSESPKARHQVLRELIQSVRRDLENLLNTRRPFEPYPPELVELKKSLVSYGLADITGTNIGSESGRDEFRRSLERTIAIFESRFQSVRVQFLENAEQLDRIVRFRVTAMLRLDPAPERVVFDSQLEPISGGFAVKSEDS